MSDDAVAAQLMSYLPPDRLRAVLGGGTLPEFADGATLFADISGFTPLTEAVVARYGARRGGEELTDRLNNVYDALIGEVDRLGGSVIGFAGDAVTCWFDGDDGLRATACALQMRARLAAIGEIRLPDGATFSLGMKVAVATGRVRRFIVGAPEVALFDVMSGHVLEHLADAEHEAGRGDIVLDQSAADALGSRIAVARWKTRALDGRRYALVERVLAPVEPRPWPPVDFGLEAGTRLKPWLVPQVHRRLVDGGGDFLTELRPAAAVFVRFSGIDFRGDPEAAARLDTYFRWVQAIVARLEGIVVQLTIGDKGSFLYAAFGAPVAHDDDTRRALTAALEIGRPPPAIAAIAGAVQIGVTRGTMRTGAYGGRTRRTYGVLGDEVNLAARFMARAAAGEILVSAPAAQRHRGIFELEELQPVRVKGKSEPVPVYRLLGRRTAGIAGLIVGRDNLAPMIGRREELEHAVGRLELVPGGRGQIVAISGEAGMGKSRLLIEVLRSVERLGFSGFAADCPVLAREASYSVWAPIWRSFFAIAPGADVAATLARVEAHLAAIDPTLVIRAPLIGTVLNIQLPDNELTRTLEGKVRRASLDSLLIECVRQRSRREPLLFVIEEAHWIDGASRHLLRALAQAIARLPVAIVLTHRPVQPGEIFSAEETSLDYLAGIELGDLGPDDTRALVGVRLREAYRTERDPPPRLVELIATRANGNPFFIEEVARLLHSRAVAWDDPAGLDTLELPASLHSLVLGRIDQISADGQTTLKVASVIGRVFRTAMLFGVHPVERGRLRIPEHVREMCERDITEAEPAGGEEAWLFKHIVIQEVAYESLPFALRATIHEAIGRHIEALAGENLRPWLDLLAFHFDRSGCDDKKRHYLVAAGDAARESYALQSGISYYERALRLLEGASRIDVLLRLGEMLEFAGRWDDAFARYLDARTLAEADGTPAQRATTAGVMGDFHRKRSDFTNAALWLERAREENAGLGNDSGVAHVLHLLGTLAAQSGDFARATALFHQALAIRERLGEELNAAKTLNNLGIVARSQGDADTALRHYERSLQIRRRLNDRREIANSLNNLGFAYRYRQEYGRARELLEESVAMNRAIGDRWSTANALGSLAEVGLDTRDAALAGRCLRESIVITRELGDRRALAYLLEGCGQLGCLHRRAREALLFFAAAKRLREAIGAPLEPADARKIDAMAAEIRASIDADASAGAEAEGARLPLGQALDLAATAFA